MFKRWTVTIVILGLLVIPLLTVRATDGGGAWAQATAYMTKEFGLDLAARAIARNLLNNLVSGLVSKIQTGGEDGGPAFVQNWRNFQTDSQYRGENVFRSILGATSLCGYVDKDVKGLFGATSPSSSPQTPGGSSGPNQGSSNRGGLIPVYGTGCIYSYNDPGSADRKCSTGNVCTRSATRPGTCATTKDVCQYSNDCAGYNSGDARNFCAGTCLPELNLNSPVVRQAIPAGQNTRVGNFDPFALRSACTMPSNFNTTDYQKDFSGNGGWNAWSRMLEPQNNYYGLLFGSLDEAGRQRALEQSGDASEAQAGSGYTSIKDSCVGSGANAKCTFLGMTKTPGDLLGKTAAATIDSDLQWLTSSDELSEVIISIINASINRLVNLATSKTANDYNNAPPVIESAANNYTQCMNACNEFDPSDPYHQTCVLDCSRNSGAPVPDPIETPEPNPAPPQEPGQTGGVCASPEEIAQFLVNNPGDQGRLSSAFPCP